MRKPISPASRASENADITRYLLRRLALEASKASLANVIYNYKQFRWPDSPVKSSLVHR